MSLTFIDNFDIVTMMARPAHEPDGEGLSEDWEKRIEYEKESRWDALVNPQGNVFFKATGSDAPIFKTDKVASTAEDAIEMAKAAVSEHLDVEAIQHFLALARGVEEGVQAPKALSLLWLGGAVLAAVIAVIWLAT